MKPMKRVLALLLALAALTLLLVSCTETEKPADGETTSAPAPAETEPPMPAEVDLTLYTLIRSDESPDAVTKTLTTLRTAMQKATGVNPKIGTDYVSETESTRGEYEIIVGQTNIPEAEAVRTSLKEGEYAIRFLGKKIVLAGYTDRETTYAAMQFCQRFLGVDYTDPQPPASPVKVVKAENVLGKPDPDHTLFYGDPIEMTTKNFATSGCSIANGAATFRSTGTLRLKKETDSGAFRARFRVKTNGVVPERVQFFISSSVSKILVHQIGGVVQLELTDYQRGGRGFSDSLDDYTLRADVYPEGRLIRYYANDKLLGEVNLSDEEQKIADHSSLSIAVVGNGLKTEITDFYVESIPETEQRRYDAVPIEVGNEEVYPKSQNKPDSTIYVVNAAGLSNEQLLCLVTLQGNVNRTTPRLFVDYRKYNNDSRYCNVANDESYLKILESKGRKLVTIPFKDVIRQFRDDFVGLVLGSPFANGYEENVITSVCAATDSIYVPASFTRTEKYLLGKPVVYNCAEKDFKNDLDAYRRVWEEFGDKFSKTCLFHVPTGSDYAGHPTMICRDYAVMAHAFTFCSEGVHSLEDYDFYMSIFASTAPNTGVFGQGGGLFNEFEMFKICGQFGKYFTYAFSTPNLSLLNSLEVGELKQSAPEPVSLEKGTTYTCYDLSEGDNLSWDYHLWMKEYYDTEKRAATPKGYSLSGATYYLCPALIEYYYQNATPADCFFLDGGGISDFSSPDAFGLLLKKGDREKAVTRMLQLTEYVLEKTDIHVLRVIDNVTDEMAARYDKEVPNLTMLLSSYGNYTASIGGYGSDYQNAIKLIGDLVRVRCAFSTFKKTMGESYRELVAAAPSRDKTYFCEVFAYANRFFDNFSTLKELEAEFRSGGCKNLKIVRADQFAELYRQYATEKSNG